jgi:fatty acid desaturase
MFFVLINTLLVAIWLFLGGFFWPIWSIIGCGLALVIVHNVFKFTLLSDTNKEVVEEYNRLKETQIQ